jgi:hypothetical protein
MIEHTNIYTHKMLCFDTIENRERKGREIDKGEKEGAREK